MANVGLGLADVAQILPRRSPPPRRRGPRRHALHHRPFRPSARSECRQRFRLPAARRGDDRAFAQCVVARLSIVDAPGTHHDHDVGPILLTIDCRIFARGCLFDFPGMVPARHVRSGPSPPIARGYRRFRASQWKQARIATPIGRDKPRRVGIETSGSRRGPDITGLDRRRVGLPRGPYQGNRAK